mgnify:CR=1 FL=1
METRIRVRYAETDAQGIAYHSNYLVWFEVARTELFRRAVGESPGDFFRSYGMPVIEASVRYHQPCRYDDELSIGIELSQLRSRSLRFDYSIRRDGDLVSEGHTVHVCVDGGGAPCRIPLELRQALATGEHNGDGSR